METTSGHRSREYAIGGSRFRAQEDDGLDTESISSGFEFQRVERAPPHRLVSVAPFSKPAPSKWDDAQKWIASPTSNRVGNKAGGGQTRKGGFAGHGSRQPVTKVVLEVEEADTKRVDGSQAKKEFVGVESVNWVTEPYAEVDSAAKPVTIMENPVADIAGKKTSSDTCRLLCHLQVSPWSCLPICPWMCCSPQLPKKSSMTLEKSELYKKSIQMSCLIGCMLNSISFFGLCQTWPHLY